MTKPFLNDDLAKLSLRLAVGGLMLFHGAHKITNGVGAIKGLFVEQGLPGGLAHLVYLGEVVAPGLMILGFLTRVAGLLVTATMAVAIYLALGPEMFGLNRHGGAACELELLYLAGGLALFLSGGGRYSVTRGEGRWS